MNLLQLPYETAGYFLECSADFGVEREECLLHTSHIGDADECVWQYSCVVSQEPLSDTVAEHLDSRTLTATCQIVDVLSRRTDAVIDADQSLS